MCSAGGDSTLLLAPAPSVMTGGMLFIVHARGLTG